MKCSTCGFGETADDFVTQFLERDGKSVIIREVPASVCTTCGEVYFGAATTKERLPIAEQAIEEDERILEKTYSPAWPMRGSPDPWSGCNTKPEPWVPATQAIFMIVGLRRILFAVVVNP